MRLDLTRRLLVLSVALSLALPLETEEAFTPISRAKLCVTEGAIGSLPGNKLTVDVPKMRAFVDDSTEQAIQTHFTYLGPTAKQSQLGSGATRVQFGLKLHAKDACNLVYAMWRIEPESELVISLKRNPGQHTSSQCANHGYQNIKPDRSKLVPPLRPGDSHRLRAQINGLELTVFVDDSVVWEGSLPRVVLGFQGAVGIRSDNARLELQISVREAPPVPRPSVTCRPGPEESD
jgi:hypothetical protein